MYTTPLLTVDLVFVGSVVWQVVKFVHWQEVRERLLHLLQRLKPTSCCSSGDRAAAMANY